MMSIEFFRLYIIICIIIIIHVYLLYVIPYIPVFYFNNMQYFFPLCACAYDMSQVQTLQCSSVKSRRGAAKRKTEKT